MKTKKNQNPPANAAELRRRAEDRLQTRERNPQSAQQLVHELQVHQIELEMQNEELMQARAKADALLAQYTDLYEFASTGYFNLAADGTILAVNLTGAGLLGLGRVQLLNRRLGFLVSEADRPVFSAFLEKTFAETERQCCEVALLSRLDSVGTRAKEPQRRDERREESGGEGAPTNHLSVTDSQATETGLSRRPSQCKRPESRNSSKIFSPAVFSALIASLRFKGRSHFGCGSAAPSLCGLTGPPSTASLRLRAETEPLFVRIEAVVSAGRGECRADVLDVTDRHRVEAERERLIQELTESALTQRKKPHGEETPAPAPPM